MVLVMLDCAGVLRSRSGHAVCMPEMERKGKHEFIKVPCRFNTHPFNK